MLSLRDCLRDHAGHVGDVTESRLGILHHRVVQVAFSSNRVDVSVFILRRVRLLSDVIRVQMNVSRYILMDVDTEVSDLTLRYWLEMTQVFASILERVWEDLRAPLTHW